MTRRPGAVRFNADAPAGNDCTNSPKRTSEGSAMLAIGQLPDNRAPIALQAKHADLQAGGIGARYSRLARRRRCRQPGAMSATFPNLFQPLTLRHKTLRNRIVFGSHTANMSEGGLPGDRHLGYYRERAMGGAAMIVVEPMPVHRTAVLTRGNFRPEDDAVIPHFRRIADAVHEHGAVICQQLYHVGQHGDWDNSFEP